MFRLPRRAVDRNVLKRIVSPFANAVLPCVIRNRTFVPSVNVHCVPRGSAPARVAVVESPLVPSVVSHN